MSMTATRRDTSTRQHIGELVRDRPSARTGFDVVISRTGRGGDGLSPQDRSWPGQMRRVGREHLRMWGLDALGDSIELLLSELVTNGFRHGRGGPVGVRLWRTEVCVCVEVVSGGGAQVPCVREAGVSEESGRGLWLVDAVADAWGVTADGSCTWCLLAVPRTV
ncbi:ATP-binding protein [Streptomyces sp. NPDC020965]|uniref:ATP-binding protein n=1 Tax=Streptomyces sp. NPDC020965 TaxID=3365105 RepID=UPI00379EDFCB